MPLPVSLYGREDMEFADEPGEDAAATSGGPDGPGSDLSVALPVVADEDKAPDDIQADGIDFADQAAVIAVLFSGVEQTTAGQAVEWPDADLFGGSNTITASEQLPPVLTSRALKPGAAHPGASEKTKGGALANVPHTPPVFCRATRRLIRPDNETDTKVLRAPKPRVPDGGPQDNSVPSMMRSRTLPKPDHYLRY